MTVQNYCAIIGMCSIVITLYAMKNSHAHFLPDLFGLALALTAQRPSMAIGCVIIAFIVRHSQLAYGLADLVPEWLWPLVIPRARDMLSSDWNYSASEPQQEIAVLATDQDDENTEESRRVAENDDKIILAARVELAAKSIASGALGLTEATRLAAGANSGRKYQKYSRLIKAEMKRMENHYADLDSRKNQIPPPPR